MTCMIAPLPSIGPILAVSLVCVLRLYPTSLRITLSWVIRRKVGLLNAVGDGNIFWVHSGIPVLALLIHSVLRISQTEV